MATVETVEYRRSVTISAASSASEQWRNDGYTRDVLREAVKRSPYLFFGEVVESYPVVVKKKKYLDTPKKPLKDNPFLVELGGAFEQVGGSDEAIGGGDQKMGSSN